MELDSKIYVASHRGMVESAIVRELQRQGYMNIITRTHKELDLINQAAVEEFFEKVLGRKLTDKLVELKRTLFSPKSFNKPYI